MVESCCLPVFFMIVGLSCRTRCSCLQFFSKGKGIQARHALNTFFSLGILKWPFWEETEEKKKMEFQVSSYFREVLVKNNHYVSSSETLKFEQLCLAFRSLQSQQAQVQIRCTKASLPGDAAVLYFFPSLSCLSDCASPQQFLQCYTGCITEEHLEEQSKHEYCLSGGLWGEKADENHSPPPSMQLVVASSPGCPSCVYLWQR